MNTCPLCQLYLERFIYTQLHYEDETIIIVDCDTCRVPMVVLKEHRASFRPEEKKLIGKKLINLFGKEGYIDWQQRKIPYHAHCHLRKNLYPDSLADLLRDYE